jgi:hypothetical protein
MALKLNERYPGRFNNPSADYPQGSFKNRTSPTAKDGSYLEQDWANDKEGFFQSLLSSAGIVSNGTVDKVGASQYMDALALVTRKTSAGVVGQARNARMSVAAASATASFTADEVIVETALGGIRYCLTSFNKTINLATVGAGGMDTGAAPASGFVGIYAIYNPTTGVSALLAVNATAGVVPEVYGGANMPAGYTASALVSVWGTSSSLLKIGSQSDRRVDTVNSTVLSSTTPSTTPAALSVSAVVPPNAKIARTAWSCVQGTAGIGVSLVVASSSSNIGAIGVSSANTSGTGQGSIVAEIQMVAPQTIYYFNASTAATTNSITIVGYIF